MNSMSRVYITKNTAMIPTAYTIKYFFLVLIREINKLFCCLPVWIFQKKRKTHQEVTEEDVKKVPHSFVMHKGEVGKSVLQLEMDIRHVMEPYTATKLKVYSKI